MNLLTRKLSIALVNSSLESPYHSYGDHWRDAFIDAGCDVTIYPYQDIGLIPPRHDLYFFVEIRYDCALIPWYLSPRVLYSWDSHIIDLSVFEGASKCFDKVLLASKIDVESLKRRGTTNVAWVPEGCNPRVHRNLHADRPVKLGYIGHTNSSMARNGATKNDFIAYLTQSPYGLYREEGFYGEAYTAEQNKIKVMFDRTIGHNIGTRIFESSAAGCVPLWSDARFDTGIEDLLVDGAHYVSYNDTIEGLEHVLTDLFMNESRMTKIAKAAEQHVLNNHTYMHRVFQILKLLEIRHTRHIS